MNFSELFKHSNQLCQFSPDGKLLANVVQYRLIIRDVKTLTIIQLYTCLDAIEKIEWSSDSQFVLCGMYKRGLVQVWSLEQPEWTCKIDEGSAGLIAATWAPDARHILTTADFSLRITVWSLVNKTVSYIKYPKDCEKGLSFSKNQKYLALAERRDCKDYISVFTTSSWQLLKHFETDTEDLAGVEWSPDSRVLCVWESPLKYKVLIYSMDGRCLSTVEAYQHALGIKQLAWSPTSQFLALGSYDQKVRILNHITWKTITELEHPTVLDTNSSNVVIYKESVKKPALLQGEKKAPETTLYTSQSKYEVVEGEVKVPLNKPDHNKANPRVGVGAMAFSTNSKFFYTRNDNMPTAVWIWDVQRLTLAGLLLQESPVKCLAWDPCSARLALCCANNKIYMWSPSGALSVEVPSEAIFTVHTIKWHAEGKSLLLLGKDQMCMCFLRPEQANNEPGEYGNGA